nr:OmpA family protein [Flavilitoribacter sp.]
DSWYDDDGSIPYLLNVYYEVGRSSVKKESVPELIRLFNVLEDNPDLSIEIASHTDARGSDKFNENLSQRRAEAIVRYLIEKGISKSRLRAKGYGESRPVNDCVDGKDCPEDLYQMNRRTEFRVVDKS